MMDKLEERDFPLEWLKEVVSYFSQMGFFLRAEPTERDLRFIAHIANLEEELPSQPLLEMAKTKPEKLIEYEQNVVRLKYGNNRRVWCEDTEADFVDGDYWYVKTLIKWSRISLGHFRPQNLWEVWPAPRRDEEGDLTIMDPLQVGFTLGEKAFKFQLNYRDGWFDYNLIRGVNEAIHNTGRQFASVWLECSQDSYVCCLTMDQVTKLRRERGWRFHEEFFVDGGSQGQEAM